MKRRNSSIKFETAFSSTTIRLIKKVQGYISKNGMKYVLEKIELTERQPRDNMAGYFLAALRDDYKMPVRYVPAKKVKPKPQPSPIPVEPYLSEETCRIRAEKLRE